MLISFDSECECIAEGGMVGLFALLLAWSMSLKREHGSNHSNPISTSTVLLQFDGSWKPPTDPGMPTANRMAACAACLTAVVVSKDSKEDNRDARQRPEDQIAAGKVRSLRLMGGKILASSERTSSSAVVEYEGLLLGLEGLELYLQEQHALKQHQQPCRDDADIPEIIHIRVQGDCKTVLGQMSQASRPRKLQSYHRRAVAKIDKLQFGHSCRFVFEHIPRAQNVLCDRISALLLWDQQQAALDRAARDLQNMTTTTTTLTKFDPSTSRSLIAKFVAEHLSGCSLIPYSKRPWIYQCLAGMAAASHDWDSLLSMGEQLQREVETEWTQCTPLSETLFRSLSWKESFMQTGNAEGSELTSLRYFAELLLVEALVYRIEALKKLGRAKESDNLQRKKRFILSKYSSKVTLIEHRLAAGQVNVTKILPLYSTEGEEEFKEKWPLEVLEWYETTRRPYSLMRREDEIVYWGKWKVLPNISAGAS